MNNPHPINSQPWALTITGDKSDIFDLADELGFDGPFTALSVSVFEKDGDIFYVQALYETQAEAKAALQTLTLAVGVHSDITQLPDEDWVSKSQEGLAPIHAGRFLIYGTHDAGHVDLSDKIGLQIDAGLAFGSGHHGTTSGCLILFDRLLQQGSDPKNILDLGCGAGILSIGAAKALTHHILATDIDQDAVDVTRQNAVLNHVGNKVEAERVDGFDDPLFKDKSFDLIFANILAAPLMAMAPEILRHMDIGGHVILSGILKEQKNTVATHFNGHGLDIIDDEPQNEWVSLLGRKRSL